MEKSRREGPGGDGPQMRGRHTLRYVQGQCGGPTLGGAPQPTLDAAPDAGGLSNVRGGAQPHRVPHTRVEHSTPGAVVDTACVCVL